MKIIRHLYYNYTLSFLICLSSCIIIFFIFSLLGNLNENYSFNLIVNISLLNSIQILTFVPAFIFLLSIILFIVLMRSKNELIIIKSYLSFRKLLIFYLPIVFIFTILEINKKDLNQYIENIKINLTKFDNMMSTRITILEEDDHKKYAVYQTIDEENLGYLEYHSYVIFDNKIQTAEFSRNTYINENKLILTNFTEYKDNLIKNHNSKKMINNNFSNLINQNSLVKYISKENKVSFDIKKINFTIFFLLFFSYIFFIFFNSKLVSSKESLKQPLIISLMVFFYSFFVFNSSITLFKEEFELIASLIIGTLLLKNFLYE